MDQVQITIKLRVEKCLLIEIETHLFQQFLDSLVVRISACHVEGPGSIPGRGETFMLSSSTVFTMMKASLDLLPLLMVHPKF